MKLVMRKQVIVACLLMLVLAFTGCQTSSKVANTNEGGNSGAYDNIGEDGLVTFEMVLGRDIDKLNEDQISVLRDLYSEIENYEFAEDGSADDGYYELLDGFDYKMMDYGLDVPFLSYTEAADKYRDQFNDRDYSRLIKLDEDYMEMMNDENINEADYDDENSSYNRLIGEIEALFDKAGLPGEEVTTQILNRSVHYALYDVKNGHISLSIDSMDDKNQLSNEEKILYKKLWKHIVKIVPKAYMDMLVKFEVNTDGVENVMAHVVEETEDYSKWRLAIDLKDAINPDGSFSDEFTNTIIHEFAHVMTLHKGEMQGDNITDEAAYSTTEGTLKTKSYLNQFYQRFWTGIIEEHAAAEALDVEDENQSGDAIYAFYEKYEDQFVSDYAATNPAEDIAETYRVFVTEAKPTGDSIKDQKIMFMYEYPELVKIREDIRTALAL